MSPQLKTLENLIAAAEAENKSGNGAALRLIRTICEKAATAAPKEDLLAMARHLIHLGTVDRN